MASIKTMNIIMVLVVMMVFISLPIVPTVAQTCSMTADSIVAECEVVETPDDAASCCNELQLASDTDNTCFCILLSPILWICPIFLFWQIQLNCPISYFGMVFVATIHSYYSGTYLPLTTKLLLKLCAIFKWGDSSDGEGVLLNAYGQDPNFDSKVLALFSACDIPGSFATVCPDFVATP